MNHATEAGLLVFERLLGWLWTRWRGAPVGVSASHHDLYETSSITLAVAPNSVEWANVGREAFYAGEAAGDLAFVVPTAIVATVSNGNSNRRFQSTFARFTFESSIICPRTAL